MKELQNVWNLSAAMDLRTADIKQQNKNVHRLLFLFSNILTNTRWKQEVKRMCLNGITCRGTHQVKKVKEPQCS